MSVYYEVASHINRYYPVLSSIPDENDFPLVSLFKKILTIEEARCLLYLTDEMISAKRFSVLVGLPIQKVEEMLTTLSTKGVVFLETEENEVKYKLMPLCPGLLEAVIAINDDKEIAKDVHEFLSYIHEQSSSERIISLNQTIDTTSLKLTQEEVTYYLDSTDSYALADCACRKLNKNAHKDCGHPIEDMCIILGKYADFYVRTNRGKKATRQKVEEVLKKADSMGMYHQVFSSETTNKSAFICNCCSCGCLSMWMTCSIDTYLSEEVETKVNIDASKCIGCGDCARACPSESLVVPVGEKVPILAGNSCFSCGLCEAVCSRNAVKIS